MNEKSPFINILPPQAATNSGQVDGLFWFLNFITLLFTLLVVAAIVTFAVKYRRGAHADRSNAPLENLPLEIAWTAIPLLLCFVIFGWGAVIFFRNANVPKGAMNIYVVGKQWMWKVQQPSGRWEQNEIHVPVGVPVQLTMTSEDVLHDFFIPAFRLKADVIPGRYTSYWFEATKPGKYHLYCAEYCGTFHSKMGGTVIVQEKADYERWLKSGNVQKSRAVAGEKLFRQYGCSGCHGLNSSVKAPLLEGIYGRGRALEDGSFVIGDDRYLRDSIYLPQKEVRAGFKPIMPTFKGRMSEADVLQIIDYIKSTGGAGGNSISSSDSNKGNANPYGTGAVGNDDISTRSGIAKPQGATR